ncbi:MAG: hypothetical protein HUK09_07160 [Bacteroidaceae bacterium]|nr:hypothetical protein [Bacteroidaceae bacterium]
MKNLLLGGLLLSCLPLSAQKYLTLRLADGTEQSYAIDTDLRIRLSVDEGFQIARGGQSLFVAPRDRVAQLWFAPEPTGIDALHTDGADDFDRLPPGTPIQVYALDGRRVTTLYSPLSTLHPRGTLHSGCYLLRAGRLTRKILVP